MGQGTFIRLPKSSMKQAIIESAMKLFQVDTKKHKVD